MQVAIDFLQLIAVSTGVAILIGFLVATNYLQRKALDRATDIILCCAPQLKATRAYADAQRYFDRRTPEKVSRIVETAQNIIGAGQGPGAQSTAPAEHRSRDRLRYLPEIVLILITLVFSLVAFFGTKYSEGGVASYVLGGKAAIA